jgi:hypothetical protein
MKNFYLAITEQEEGKNFAFVVRYYNCNNLLSTLLQYRNLKFVHIYDSKKKAEETVEAWNKDFKANGTYKE